MRPNTNSAFVTGWLYSYRTTGRDALKLKVSGEKSKNPGTEFIQGEISIATDDKHTNIVTVYFPYITKTNKSGKVNDTFTVLKNILDGQYGMLTNPTTKDNAVILEVSGSIGLNDFYSTTQNQPVSVKRVQGQFLHVRPEMTRPEKERATFNVDTVIVKASQRDAVENDNGEVTIPEKVVLDCRLFSYQNREILPMELSVTSSAAMDWFLNQEPSNANPLYINVTGKIVSEQVSYTEVNKGAFSNTVREVSRSYKDFVVDWAAEEPFDYGAEEVMTGQELATLAAAREINLADIKKNALEYSNRAITSSPVPKTTTATYDF